MHSLPRILEKVGKVADVHPEYDGANFDATKEPYEELLGTYPHLKNCPDYLEFLRLTSGAGIGNKRISFMLYGFGGYVVAAFDEGFTVLDEGRYFIFGEILTLEEPKEVNYFFAFDLNAGGDAVYFAVEHDSEYRFCSPSFVEFMLEFSKDRMPDFMK